MSVYNGEKYLYDAVQSILNQTYSDFEFIIIDDASTDNSFPILKNFNDSRIKIISNLKRMGLTNSLNIGLLLAEGEYIARMDADDISLSERLEYQVRFLDRNPDVAVVGTNEKHIDANGNELFLSNLPSSKNLVRWGLYFGNCICHPSVMMRYKCLREVGFYNTRYSRTQDYDLWMRLLNRYDIANIPHILFCLRNHQNSVSVVYSIDQRCNLLLISEKAYFELINEQIPRNIVEKLQNLKTIKTFHELLSATTYLYKIYNAFITKYTIPNNELWVIRFDVLMRCFKLLKGAIS